MRCCGASSARPRRRAPRRRSRTACWCGLEVVVIAGLANPRIAELRAPAGIQIVPAADDMAARMRWADLAVVAAGGTCWELAATATPALAVVVADNQLDVGAAVARLGLGRVLAAEATTAELEAAIAALVRDRTVRAEMMRRGPQVIDGRGAERACAALRDDGAA
jgi:UDP-2,4-diacetamido-2,4,6-trideoxy-beta-L-altropyranose hydrolase